MTRDAFEAHIQCLLNCFDGTRYEDQKNQWVKRIKDHEAEQRETIARLREALDGIVKIRFLLGNDPKLNPAYEMGDIAQQALKE